ncbi:MAG: HAD-IA family hydrolase [Defluviitaleaceae bacterium]|nr:HAD-IA family hydrolase [Defluviitaleaceae bacterium]
MYDTYLFDLDGTLTDPVEGITKTFQATAEAFGIRTELADLARFIGPPLRDSFKELGVTDENVEQAVEKYRDIFWDKGIFQNKLYPDLPKVLAQLKSDGKTLAVATNKVTAQANRILDHFDLAQYFSFVSGDNLDGSLSRNGKAEIIRIALDNTGGKNAVMIGDRKHDILGAIAAGVDSIGILWGYGSRDELETAGATYIINEAAEILSLTRTNPSAP